MTGVEIHGIVIFALIVGFVIGGLVARIDE